jgi:peptidoglycan endopeptidase LytE
MITASPAAAATGPARDPASDLLITAATNDLLLPETSMPSAGTGLLGTRAAQRVASDRRRQEQAAADQRAREAAVVSTTGPSTTNRTALAQSRHGSDVAGFLACTKVIESNGNYAAVSPDGIYHGAYQFDQPTWNGAVTRAGYPQWAGRDPANAPAVVQDAAAVQLYAERGNQPWGGRC